MTVNNCVYRRLERMEKVMKVLTQKEVKLVSGGVIEGPDGKGCTEHQVVILGGKNKSLSL